MSKELRATGGHPAMGAYKIEQEMDYFLEAGAHFEGLLAQLKSEEFDAKEQDELEEFLVREGRELERLLLQGHLDQRAAKEPRHPVLGSDDVERTHLRDSQRPLETTLGTVVVSRLQLGARGKESLHPLDAELNLPATRHSFCLQKQLAEEVAKSSFEETLQAVRKTTAAKLSKRQVEVLAESAAQDFDAFYAQYAVEPISAHFLLVLSFDGKGVVVRRKDLRPATRKAAESSNHKLEKRLSRGEKKNRKRMCEVAAVYDLEPAPRTVEDVIDDLRPVRLVKPPRPKPKNKRVWASVRLDLSEIVKQGFDEAERRDPAHQRRWVVLVDGNPEQIACIRREAEQRRIEVTLVLDFIHVAEYLWKAAYCFFPRETKEAEAWVSERLANVLRGKSSEVAGGIRRSATLRGLSKAARKAADKCAKYLVKNRKLLRYDEALAAGLPIATGVIEGACRHLVKDRMDITGARWSLAGADAVLRLRALRSSHDFDEYWSFHSAQEHQRNHLSRYANGNPRARDPHFAGRRAYLHVVGADFR